MQSQSQFTELSDFARRRGSPVEALDQSGALRRIGADEADATFGGVGDIRLISLRSIAQLLQIAALVALLVIGILCLVFILEVRKRVDDDDDGDDESAICSSSGGAYGLSNGTNCIYIAELPIELESYKCYRLSSNFIIGPSQIGITISGKRNIELYYDNHEIFSTGNSTPPIGANLFGLPLFITNSTNIKVYDASHRTPVADASTSFAAIIVGEWFEPDRSCTGVRLIRPALHGFRWGVLASFSDVHIEEPRIISAAPGNGTSGTFPVVGIGAIDALNTVVRGGYISIPFLLPNSPFEASVFGFLSASWVTRIDPPATPAIFPLFVTINGTNQASCAVDGLVIDKAQNGLHIAAGKLAIVRNTRVQADPNAAWFSSPFAVFSSREYSSVILERNTVDCSTATQYGDCVYLAHGRSTIVDGMAITGRLAPVADYQSALLWVSGGFGWSGLPAEFADPILLSKVTIHALDSDTIGMKIGSQFSSAPRTQLVHIDRVSIYGGLVGIEFVGNATNAVVERASIAESIYGVAAVQNTHAVHIKHSSTFHNCIGYLLDSSTSNIVLELSTAFECGIGVTDSGSGNVVSSMNNVGETGEECTAPDLYDALSTPAQSTPADSYVNTKIVHLL
jgi:hypothetical protein